ncbi:hypothetical protein MTX78_18265 [Hymenobacter tibetensis]|uniref:Uncharacterized protein n=1 Tax=Hymenobacter tibetensis TaxID=497967 RepID=A0ABY4CYJ5_9BACT|nr:hypothetical protein [Hymenobacter tibetensis]UOG74054.1 hypothetical protein MTX78_18265 [Hymenobacter tibetensis]
MQQQVTQAPLPAPPAGSTYHVRSKSKAAPAPVVRTAKTLPVEGDNLLWHDDPATKVGWALGGNENYHHEFGDGKADFTISGFMRVIPGKVVTSNIDIYVGNYYDINKKYVGHFGNGAFRNKGTVPANAHWLKASYLGRGNFRRAAVFLGDFGGGDRSFAAEPYKPAWHLKPVVRPATKSRSQWTINYLGVLGSTTADPRYSVFPESGYNAYRAAASGTYGLVCAKGFNENAPLLVVHPWKEINRRRAIRTDINSECYDVATNGTHVFALLNNNARLTYTQKYVGVFDLATQLPVEIKGGKDLVGYADHTMLRKVMAWEGHQVPNPGNEGLWKNRREEFVNTWKNSGIAAEKGANKLVAISCDKLDRIEIRRFPNNAVIQTISIDMPRRMAFTPDGALWVVCGEDYSVPYTKRTTTKLIKFVNQSTNPAAPNFKQVQVTAIPFLAGVMGEADNGVLVGVSGTRMQYVKLNSAGVEQFAHGAAGGNTATAVVTDNTYTLLNHEPLQDGDWENYVSFSARAPDGSIWLGNPGGFEIKHWNATMTQHLKADRIGYLPDFFNLAFDKAQKSHLHAEMYLMQGNWSNIRSFSIVRNWRLLLPKYLLSPHCAQTYTSKDGRRKSTVIFCQDTRFNEPNKGPYPNGMPNTPGYQCEMIKLPEDGSAPIRSSQWFDFEPNTGRTWTLYPEGIRTFENHFVRGQGWRTRVLFRPFVDLANDANGFPIFGKQVVVLDELTQAVGQEGKTPLPVPGWNRQYTCPQFPNGAFAGMETAYRPLGCHHLGYLKPGVSGWFKLLLPNKVMKTEVSPGIYNVPGYWPDITTDKVFGGHFSAGLDIAGKLCYVFQDGQFSKYKSNATTVYDQDGNFVMEFGRQQDNGPGFNSQNMDPYGYGNNCGQARVLELDNGDHIVLRATENGGGYSAYRNVKPAVTK